MDISLDIAIQSHLSDAIIETSFNPPLARKRIRFAKHLLLLKNSNIDRMSEEDLNRIWNEIDDCAEF